MNDRTWKVALVISSLSSFMTPFMISSLNVALPSIGKEYSLDAIELSWREGIQACYPEATEILLTFDCGGANAARSLRFKEDVIELSDRLGLPLRIAHYPPYTSKWHPIEHRLFSHVERSLRGVILDCHDTALDAVQRTRTKTGLHVTARILDRVYDIGRKCSDTFRDIKDNFIRHDAVVGQWNYLVDARGFG